MMDLLFQKADKALSKTPPEPAGQNQVDRGIHLNLIRIVARLSIFWERFWPLVLPFVLTIAVFLIVSWIGLWLVLPEIARIALLGLFAVVAITSLLPLRYLRFASNKEVDFRIERRSGLLHRPVTAQSDRLAGGHKSVFGEVLWREHQTRMEKKLTGLKSGVPAPGLAARDPYGLRAIILLLLFVAFGYANGDYLARIESAFQPNIAAARLLARLDVWVSPPPYTNRAPLFLKRSGKNSLDLKTTTVPEGSQLVLRVVGQDTLSLDYVTSKGTDQLTPVSDISKQSNATEYRYVLNQSGQARLLSAGSLLGEWSFIIIPDIAPVIRFDKQPRRGRGRMLDLAYSLNDDYGVVSAIAEIRPLAAKDPLARPLVKPLDLALVLPRRPAKSGKAKVSRDVYQHPLAGGRVEITLVAKDGAGQTGRSDVKEVELPGRVFTKPLAAALVEQRRILAIDARDARQVGDMLEIIADTAPEEFIKSSNVYLGLQVAYRGIDSARDDDDLREILELLWTMALSIEDGDLSDSALRLREAQEALKKALENGASDEEISRLMKELRQAMNNYLRELTEQMARNQNNRNNQNAQQNQNSQTLRRQDIDRMMNQIEDLAKSGSRDAAKQLLSELQQMMDQLQAGLHQQQRQREGDQFNQQMNKLAEMMQRQQSLMDETFRMQQQQPRGGQNSEQNGQQQGQQNRPGEQNQQGQMTPEEYANAMRQLQQQQGDLRNQLQQMMKGLEQQGLDPGRELGEAGSAMGRARDALGKGQNGEALGQQGQALDALRRGARSMMQQMQQNMAGERGGADQNGRQRNNQSRNDPLGRQQRTRGPNFGSDVKVPDEIDAQKAREILETIRRKLANPQLPKIEFNYLDRLLKPQ